MLICILNHMNITSIIIINLNMFIMQIIIKESIFHPNDLCTTSPDNNILRLGGWEDHRILLLRIPWNKIIFKKLTSSTSAFSIHFITDIVGIRITCHVKLSVFGYHKFIPIVPLRYLIMCFIALKWDSLRYGWNLAQKLHIISSLLSLK